MEYQMVEYETLEGDQVVVVFKVADCSQRLYQLLERVVGRVADQFALCYDGRDNTLLGELYLAVSDPDVRLQITAKAL
jgi:hypothetical protein